MVNMRRQGRTFSVLAACLLLLLCSSLSATAQTPARPTGVMATAGDGQVTLSWENPNNAAITKYQYRMRIGDTGVNWRGWQTIGTSNASTTSHTVTGLTNGQAYTFVVRARIGTTNGPESSPYVFATPSAPTITLQASSDTGTKGDNITNEVAPTFTLADFPGSPGTITVSLAHEDGETTLTLTRNGNGDIVLGFIKEGTWTITATDSNDVSAPSIDITFDTTAPVITYTPFITTDTTPNITFTSSEAGTQGGDASCNIAQGTITNGSNTVTPTTALTLGQKSCTLEVSDAAGNTTDFAFEFIINSSTSTATLTLKSTSDTGLSDSDNITNQLTPTVTVGGISGGVHVVRNRGISVTTTTTDGTMVIIRTNGDYVFDPGLGGTIEQYGLFTLELAPDEFSTTPIAGLILYLDNTAPTITNISIPTSGTDTTPELTFTASEAGELIANSSCGIPKVAVVEGENTVTLTALTPKAYTGCALKMQDIAGNESSASTTIPDFTITLAAPTGLSATAGPGAGEVTLSWSDPGNSDISKYQYRQGSGSPFSWGSWADIGSSTATTTSHTVTSLTNGTEYSFQVRAFLGSMAGAASSTVTATPLALPEITIARQGSAAVTEGTNVVFRVTASRTVTANLTVNLLVVDAAAGADFISSINEGAETVTIASGQSTVDFTLSTVGDATDERSLSVSLLLLAGTGYTVGSPGFARVMVNDDDPTTVMLSIPDATALEGSSTDRATVRLTLNRALRARERLAIPLGFSGGVLGTDFSLSLSGTPTGVALSSNTVTFSGGGSTMMAEVLLSASSDADAADKTITVSIPSSSSGMAPILTATGLDGGAAGSRTGNGQITLNDNDTPALVFSSTSLTVDEGAGGMYRVKLATQPTGNVTVMVSSTSSEVTVDTDTGTNGNQNTLSFTTSDWNGEKTVTFSAGQDDDGANDGATLSHSASGGGYGSVMGDVMVTVTDDDEPALVFSPTSLTVVEGARSTYTVRLATQPMGNVTVTVAGAGGEVMVDTNSGSPGDQNELTFTTSDWNRDKTITVSAGQDDDATNDSATLTHSASGGDYGSVTGDVMVTVTDNDDPALVFSPTSLTVVEGASDTYTVRLATQPTSNVTVMVSGASGEVTVDTDTGTTGDQNTLSFTTSDWNSGKTVTVSAGQDNDMDNDGATLTHSASGGDYGSVTGDVMVTVTDNDAPALVFSPTSLTVVEGASDTYTVRLTTRPTANVMVTVSGASGEVMVDTDTGTNGDQNTLSFTTSDWNSEKTVTVSAGEDDDAANDSATLTHSASGGGYGSVTGDVMVTVTDNDMPALVLSPTSLTVDEDASGMYTVRLATQPTGNVTVTVSSTSGEVTVDTDTGTDGNQNTLSFTPSDWNSGKMVTVSAGEDNDSTDDEVTLTHTSAGGDYGTVMGDVVVTVTDNDTPALVFTPTSLTVGEGASNTYTVKLATQPTGNVTVMVSGASGEVTVDTDTGTNGDQNTLSFTPSDWNRDQTVTVSAGQDEDMDNDDATLTHSASGGDYGSVTGNLMVTVTDDDAPPNNAPTVMTMIPDQTATVGAAFNYQFPDNTFSDADNDPLDYSATLSDDSTLPGWLAFAKSTRTFSGTPQAGDVGTIMVKVTADDGNGGMVSDSFDITVGEGDALLGAVEDVEKVVIFPNPSGRYLEVRSPVGSAFKILSLSGKSLLEGTTNIKVDITSLRSGLYLVQLSDGRLLKFVRE